MSEIGFIGVGNMGGALARAAAKGENKIYVADYDALKAEQVARETGATACANAEIYKIARYIFLGVKPQVISSVLAEAVSFLKNRTDRYVLISMAAGVKIQKIIEDLSFSAPVIRIMPNLPVSVGEGMVVYTASDDVSREEIDELITAMQYSGRWDGIDEEFIDAASAVSGCGPAFCFMFAKALADGGEINGLDSDKAIKYAAQTMKGAAEMLLRGGDADSLIKAVCSPGGSTIEGVKILEERGLHNTVTSAITASYNRTKELGK